MLSCGIMGMGDSELTIAILLAHSTQDIIARYPHVTDKALIDAADIISEHIAKLLNMLDNHNSESPQLF